MATLLKGKRLSDDRKPTQGEVAQATGLDQGFYSRLESGETSVSPEIARKLAEYFDCAVNEILTPARYSAERPSLEAV